MKKAQIKRNMRFLLAFALGLLVILTFTLSQLSIYAAEDELKDVPESGVTYTLTYPDGTVVTTNEDGSPLTYQDVKEAIKEENWLKIASDLKSDSEGHVVLPSEWDINGTIKIVETKVPEGYTKGEVTEQTVALEEGTATFVNPKNPDDPEPDDPIPTEEYTITYKLNGGKYNGSTEDIKEVHKNGEIIKIHEAPTREGYTFDYWEGSKYQPGDEYKVIEDHTFTAQWKKTDESKTPSKKEGAKTGDSSGIAISLFGFIAAAMALLMMLGMKPVKAGSGNGQGASAFRNAKKGLEGRSSVELAIIIGLIFLILVAGAGLAGTVFAAEGFVINKVDDNDDPVEGAVFDIYGKPEVTWDEIEILDGNVEIRIEKVWDDGDNHDGIRPDEVKVNITADGENLTQAVVSSSDEWYYELENLPRYDSTGNEIAYLWEEEPVNGYTVASYDANTHYDGNDKFIELTITNAHTPTTDITGTKLWIDGGRTHDNASEVTLTLYRRVSGNVDAEQVAGATPTWDGSKYTFADQPIFDGSGNEYVYWVIEERVEGYDVPQHTSETGDAVGVPGAPKGGLITNELSQEYVEITVTKQWDDASDQDGKRPDDLTLALYRTGKDGDETYTQKVNWVTPEVSKSGNDWTYTFKNQLKYDSQRYEFIYEVREETVLDGYTATYKDASGTVLDSSATGVPNGGTIVNTHTPATVTVSGTKTWTSSTGNNDDLDTSKIPEKYTVRLEKSTDGTNWTTVSSQEVSSSMAPPPAPTDPIMPTDEWTFDNQPKYENGVELQYRVVEETVPAGFTMTGGTKDANGEYNITNTYTPTTGINLNVNFTQINSDLSWVAKTVPVTTVEPAQKTIRVGDQDIEVYMYTYGNPAATYYGDMPNSYSVSHWYDASGNELGPTESALIEALKDNAQLVNEKVTRDVFGGLFQDNITKNITVSGPNGFSKSYTITLGENSTYQIPITDAGEYTITQELVVSEDIDNEAFAERNTGYTGIYSIQTAVVNVTKDGDNFTCAMDKNKTMVFEHEINSSSKPYTLKPFKGGDNPYAESSGWHYGDGTSAEGDTVTINHYMKSITEQ